jgi:uncharacterized phage infection (PIP) family protein YhgE
VIVDIEHENTVSATEDGDPFRVRLDGDLARHLRDLADRYGLPKSVVSRAALAVSMDPEGGSLEERLQREVEARRKPEKESPREPAPQVQTVMDPSPILEVLSQMFRGLQERLDGLENSLSLLESQTAPAQASEAASGLQEILESLRALQARMDGLDQSVQSAYAQAAQGGETADPSALGESIQQMANLVAGLPEAISESLESRIDGALARVEAVMEERVQAMQIMVTAWVENAANVASPAASDPALAQSVDRLTGMVQVMAQDLQDLRQAMETPQAASVDTAAMEAKLAEIGEAVGNLLEESSRPFYLQSSKPIGKAFVGKLRVVKEG